MSEAGAGGVGAGRRVVVADDHAAARAGVRAALERGGFVVCAEAADGPGAVEVALRERPDACLLDVHMPGGGGIDAAAEIAARVPGTAIAMLTVSADEDDLFAAIQAGADGYLLKDESAEDIAGAVVRAAAVGESLVSPRTIRQVISRLREIRAA